MKNVFLVLALSVLAKASTPSLVSGNHVRQESSTPISTQLPVKVYGNDSYPVFHRRPLTLDTPRARFPSTFLAGSSILKNGTVRRDGARVLSCDIVLERDVPVVLRDGVTMYTDVYRPVGNGTFPVIFGWSPYGKAFGGQWLDDDRTGNRFNVPLSKVSELERFEGADPAQWVEKGYIVLSPAPRGVGKSEGNIRYWGRQLAEDGYDFIEWAGHQVWSSGKVAMTGNSFLTVSQWFIAAEQPPSLTCIAAWEGFSDHFIDAGNGGGVPDFGFADLILKTFSGTNLVEDQPKMIATETFRTPYWLDKQAQVEKITVPAYIVASYTNNAHTRGTFWAWRHIGSKEKWLRVHNTQEWFDYYSDAAVADLTKYFDYYLKGVTNDWPKTDKVRLSVLDLGHTDVVNRTENEFPLARTKYTPLFLDASPSKISNYTLSIEPSNNKTSLQYPVTGSSQLTFSHTFENDTEVTGYMALRLWVEARGSNDMELNLSVDKLTAAGVPYPNIGQIAFTAAGKMRVSRRLLDPVKSTIFEPLQLNLNESYLEPGQIVPVDINIWPMGMIYHAGETMQLTVAERNTEILLPDILGFGIAPIEVPADGGTYFPGQNVTKVTLGVQPGESTEWPAYVSAQSVPPQKSRNNGTHVFYLGGEYQSRLLIPIVPEKGSEDGGHGTYQCSNPA